MGTQVSLMLFDNDYRRWRTILSSLSEQFDYVEGHSEDFVIICKSDKDLDYFDVQKILSPYKDILDSVEITDYTTPKKEYTEHSLDFTSAYDMR